MTRSLGGATTALMTDHYELTMVQAALSDGTADHPAVFEVFARDLPPGRQYGVVAGLGRVIEVIEAFTFTPEQISWLRGAGVVNERTAQYLTKFRFTGDVDAYAEGDLYFPYSPVLTVSGTFGHCLLLETVILSILNHDCAVASAAARMVTAAGGRGLIDMGSRRTAEHSAVAAARAAYVAGFDATSNLASGYQYQIPTVGTAAHAFTLAHRDERAAFTSQVRSQGAGTTLLVDTYDTPRGIATAVEVAGAQLGAVRIDSGDLGVESRRARAQLDGCGATQTRIVVTGDLDEYTITTLQGAPVDTYGVGTRLVTGSGHPTASMVYKLVAIADEPGVGATMRTVSKKSSGKASAGGRKYATRVLDSHGLAIGEHVTTCPEELPGGRTLQVPVIRGGVVVHRPDLDTIRAHHRLAKAELPPHALQVDPGVPYLSGLTPGPVTPTTREEPTCVPH